MNFPTLPVKDIARSVSITHKKGKPLLIFLNTSDIEQGQILHRDYSQVAGWPGQAKKSISKGDILFSEIRPANGRWAFVNFAAEDYVVSTKLMVIRVVDIKVLPEFFYIWISSPSTVERLQSLAESRSGTFPQITFDDLSFLDFPIPEASTQSGIISAISALDDRIELNRRMSETLEEMARSLYRSWFVDFDPVQAKLEGRAPAHMDPATAALFPDSFGENGLPEGWTYKRLENMADVTMGLSPKGSTYNDQGVGTPLCNGPVEFGSFFLKKIKWTSAPTRLAKSGDLIVCVRGSTTGRHSFADDEYCLGRGVAGIRGYANSHEYIENAFLISLQRLLEKTTGSVFPSLSKDDLKGFELIDPCPHLIAAFSEIVRPMRNTIWLKMKENQTLATLRDTLLPKLMSGELRVGEAREQLEEVV